MRERNIAIATNILWNDSYKIGIHFFTEYFLKRGFSVSFLTQVSLLSFLDFNRLGSKLNRLRLSLKGPEKKHLGKNQTLTCYSILSFVHPRAKTPLLDSYFISKNYMNFTYPSLRKLSTNNSFDVLMFDILGIEFYPHIKTKLSIYRLCDLVSTSSPWISKGLAELEEEVLKKVDLVLAVSEPLFNKAVEKRGSSKGVHLLPNGVDIDRFIPPCDLPSDYKQISGPIALYVGNMSLWFDWEILLYAANKKREVSFVLIGSGDIPGSLPENVHFLGLKPHKQIPAYIKHADIGLIPFKNMPIIRHMERPLKYYEYIASGLPVVTVSYGAMKAMAPHAILADNPDEFVVGIEKALTFRKSEGNKLIDIAKNYSWKKIFEKFDKIMKAQGYEK